MFRVRFLKESIVAVQFWRKYAAASIADVVNFVSMMLRNDVVDAMN